MKYPDETPAADQLVRMTVRTNDGEIMEQNYTSPANGLIAFEVPDIDIKAESLNIYVS